MTWPPDTLRAPFVLGNPDELKGLLAAAGAPEAEIETLAGVARFPSVRDWMFTDMIGDAQFEQLVASAEKEVQPFVSSDGSVEFAAPAHIARLMKPAS